MPLDFCSRAARRIRGLGYPERVARSYARFFFIMMVLLCGLFGLFDSSSGTDLPVAVVIRYLNNGAGMSAADARAGSVLSAIGIQRR